MNEFKYADMAENLLLNKTCSNCAMGTITNFMFCKNLHLLKDILNNNSKKDTCVRWQETTIDKRFKMGAIN